MANKKVLSERVNELESQQINILQVLGDLSNIVKNLEAKLTKETLNEVHEVIKSQELIDQLVIQNGDKIKFIEKEIINIESQLDTDDENKIKRFKDAKKTRSNICRYYDRGYCKYRENCKFSHPSDICKKYQEGMECSRKVCSSRNPKHCKYWMKGGCHREAD